MDNIITQYHSEVNGKLLVLTYSTKGKRIKQVENGQEYDSSVDYGIYENGEFKPKYVHFIETDTDIE